MEEFSPLSLNRAWSVVLISVKLEAQPILQSRLVDFFALSPQDAHQILAHLPVVLSNCPAKELGLWVQTQLACPGAEIIVSNEELFLKKYHYLSWPETWIDLDEIPQVRLLAPTQGELTANNRSEAESANGLDRRIAEAKALYRDLDAKFESILKGGKSIKNKNPNPDALHGVEPGSLKEAQILLIEAEKKFLYYEEKMERVIKNSNQLSSDIQVVQQRVASSEAQVEYEKSKSQYLFMQLRRLSLSSQSLELRIEKTSQALEAKDSQNKNLQHSQDEVQKLLVRERAKSEGLNQEKLAAQDRFRELDQLRIQEKSNAENIIFNLQKKISELEELSQSREISAAQEIKAANQKMQLAEESRARVEFELKAQSKEFNEKDKAFHETEKDLQGRLANEVIKLIETQQAQQELEKTVQGLQESVASLTEAKERGEFELKSKIAELSEKEKSFQETEAELRTKILDLEEKLKLSQEAEAVLNVRLDHEDLRQSAMQKARQALEEKISSERIEFKKKTQELQAKISEIELSRLNTREDFLRQSQEAFEQIKRLEESEALLKEKVTHEKPFLEKQKELQDLVAEERGKLAQSQTELVRVQSQLNDSEQLRYREKNSFEKVIFNLEQKIAEIENDRKAIEQRTSKLLQEKQIEAHALEQAEKNRNLFMREKILSWEENKSIYEQKQNELLAKIEQQQVEMMEMLKKQAQAEVDFKNQIEGERQKTDALRDKVQMLTAEVELQNQALMKAPDVMFAEEIKRLEQQNQQLRGIFQARIEEIADLQEEKAKTKLLLESEFQKTSALTEAQAFLEKQKASVDELLHEALLEKEREEEKNAQHVEQIKVAQDANEQLRLLFQAKVIEAAELYETANLLKQREQELEKRVQTILLEQNQKEQEWNDKYSALAKIKDGVLSSLKAEQGQVSEISKAYKRREDQLKTAEDELAASKKEKALLEEKVRDQDVLSTAGFNHSPIQTGEAFKLKDNSTQAIGEASSKSVKTEAQHMEIMLELEDQRTRAQEWQRKARELEKELFLIRSKFADLK